MTEGWYGDDHLILFDEAEVASASDRYAISELLPGFRVIGLRGWDDFILQDARGGTYCVPTVPAIADYVSPYALPQDGSILEPDDRFEGKIKWYTTPVFFGGDPKVGNNVIWVSHDEHAKVVRYWNNLYRCVKGQPAKSVGQ